MKEHNVPGHKYLKSVSHLLIFITAGGISFLGVQVRLAELLGLVLLVAGL